MTRHNFIVPTTSTLTNNHNKNSKQQYTSISPITAATNDLNQCITPITEEYTIMMDVYKHEKEFNSFDYIANALLEQQQQEEEENNHSLQEVEASNHIVDFNLLRLRRSTVLDTVPRCDFCRRRFHSLGNLANHHQLYRH